MARGLQRQHERQMAFLAGVAHDLRNPLSALSMSTAIAEPDRPLPPEARIRSTFALVRRLLEYQQVREVVDILERRSDDRRNRFARAYLPQNLSSPAPAAAALSLSLPELFAAVDRVLRVARKPTIHDVVPRALDVDGAIATVRAVLAMRARARWGDVIDANAEPWQILSTLLALLELAKRGELRVAQSRPFASVEITGETASEAA